MSSSARVSSLQAVLDWKASLCTFTAEAKEALSSVELEIQRTLTWLEEQLKFWNRAVREGEDEVFQAKNDLVRKRMMRIGDRPPDCTEQERVLRRAQQRLEQAQEQVESTRKWLRQVPEAIIDYQGPARQLAAMLEADLPRIDALLENKIASLEGYLQVGGPCHCLTDATIAGSMDAITPGVGQAVPAPPQSAPSLEPPAADKEQKGGNP